MILLLYVDDLFVIGMDGLIADTKRKLAAKFEINFRFLKPFEFEKIASEALAWKKFLNNQAGPST